MRTRLDWDVGSLGKAAVSAGPNISTSISIIHSGSWPLRPSGCRVSPKARAAVLIRYQDLDLAEL
jgi:hypothetical protein